MSVGTATPAALAAYSTSLDEARREASLRRELPDAYADSHGYPPRQRQLDWMVRMGLWWSYAVPKYGATLELRSWPQICRALRLPDKGSARANKDAYENQLQNTLEYYARIGRVERNEQNEAKPWMTVYNGREGIGIVIRLTSAGVAQSVRTTESGAPGRRPGEPPPAPAEPRRGDERGACPASSSRELSPPPAERFQRSNRSSPWKGEESAVRADARSLREEWERHRARTAVTERARAELASRSRRFGTSEPGAVVLAELPWLVDVPLADFGRMVWQLQPELRDHPPLLSLRWRQRMEAAARRLERYVGGSQPGAAHAAVIDLIRGGWEAYRDPAGERPWRTFITQTGRRSRPVSLGAIAVCLYRQARQARRDHRLRHDPTFEARSNWLAAQLRPRPQRQQAPRREHRDSHGDPDRFYRELGW